MTTQPNLAIRQGDSLHWRSGTPGKLTVAPATWRHGKERKQLLVWKQVFTEIAVVVVQPDSLQPHGMQHARLSCPSPTPRACSNSCPQSQ